MWLLHVLKSFTLMFHRIYNLEIVTRAMKESYKLPSCKRTPQKDLGCIFLLLLKSILLLQHTRFQHIFSIDVIPYSSSQQKLTCENDVFFSNVALLAMRAWTISSPVAPCLYQSLSLAKLSMRKHLKKANDG